MNDIIFINPETFEEEKGTLIKVAGLFRVVVESYETEKQYMIDIDDVWSG